jgi:excisionase family DNA binding protein
MEKAKEIQFISVSEMSKLLGISRVAVFKKIKKGEIDAQRIGRFWFIAKKDADEIVGGKNAAVLTDENKIIIKKAVKKAIDEYGQTLRLLGKE